jgi:long-subunit acyl-CoA synthetase (AMP-forming)
MPDLKHGEEVVVSYLPLSHVAAQVNDMWLAMRFAAVTYFAEPDALKVRIHNYYTTEIDDVHYFPFKMLFTLGTID